MASMLLSLGKHVTMVTDKRAVDFTRALITECVKSGKKCTFCLWMDGWKTATFWIHFPIYWFLIDLYYFLYCIYVLQTSKLLHKIERKMDQIKDSSAFALMTNELDKPFDFSQCASWMRHLKWLIPLGFHVKVILCFFFFLLNGVSPYAVVRLVHSWEQV